MPTDALPALPAGLLPFTTLFDLTDPSEQFMVEWLSRLHTGTSRLFQVIAMKRAERVVDGKTERLIYEIARHCDERGDYVLITWNIDEVSVRWLDVSGRDEAMRLYKSMGQRRRSE